MIPNGTLYEFGILMSNVHNIWLNTIASHYGPSNQYSIDIAYNNFPWCFPSLEQKEKIEKTAQEILNARAAYPNDSLDALYDDLYMPPELRTVHRANDIAVMEAYGLRDDSNDYILCKLMRMYQEAIKR